MTVKDAYQNLGLDEDHNDEATVRKAYYKLAQQFHPDKNPEGRVSYLRIPFLWFVINLNSSISLMLDSCSHLGGRC